MSASDRTYVDARLAQLGRKRPCWSRNRRALANSRKRRAAFRRIATRPWAGR